MYHSGVKQRDHKEQRAGAGRPEARTIGRSPDCSLRLETPSVSRLHASVEVTADGYLAVHDRDSSNGTWLHRNGRWVRARRIILGTRDRVRFGDEEVALERLVELFGPHGRVRLHDAYAVRGRPLILEGEPGRPRPVFENPRRNPLTGDIEENRPPPRDARS